MNHELEAAVRRELGKHGRRLAPLALALVLVMAVLVGAPDDDVPTDVAAGFRPGEDGLGPERGTGRTGGQGGSSSSAGHGTTSGTGDVVDGSPREAATTASAEDGSGGEPPPAGGSGGAATVAGVSRTGVTCDGANRQLPESAYGPLCVPEFTGDNGGATSHGVSADEIIVTYRIGGSASMAALEALGGNGLESVGFDQRGIAGDMQVLVDYFNVRFELYGRQVRFVPYEGQGDVLQEYQNRGRQGAQADAARAKDLGAFADVSYAGQTQPYAESLASNGVVAFSPIYMSRRWHESHAPFTHSAMWPAGEDGVIFQASVVCAALHPGKAERANDAVMQTRDRRFGILHAENPESTERAVLLEERLEACGAPVARRVAYALDATRAAQTAANVVAQMQSSGVTTVLCVCDFLGPRVFMEQANSQSYVPEWFLTFHWSDPFYRTYPERQSRGMLVGGGITEPYLQTEPGEVFRAAGGGEPASPFTFDKAYQQILLLFTGLQAAGPNLNPETMFRGLQQVPDTAQGALGPWEFGPGPAMPRRWFPLGVFDPDAVSNLDGRRGSAIGCKDGRYFRFDDSEAFRDSVSCPL